MSIAATRGRSRTTARVTSSSATTASATPTGPYHDSGSRRWSGRDRPVRVAAVVADQLPAVPVHPMEAVLGDASGREAGASARTRGRPAPAKQPTPPVAMACGADEVEVASRPIAPGSLDRLRRRSARSGRRSARRRPCPLDLRRTCRTSPSLGQVDGVPRAPRRRSRQPAAGWWRAVFPEAASSAIATISGREAAR